MTFAMDKTQYEAHMATFRKCLHAVDSDDFTAVMDLQDAFVEAYFKPEFNDEPLKQKWIKHISNSTVPVK